MPDFKAERLQQALEVSFDQLAVADELEDVKMTGIELTPDRKFVDVYWVGAEGADEAEIESALERIRFELENEAEDVLRRRARVRFRMDRGAVNQRRVESILDELGNGPGADGSGADGSGADASD